MSKCDISIELNDPAARYPAGGSLRGVVTVSVNAACKCNALTLALGWHTHGQGNRAGESVAAVELFRGHWEAGRRVSYPFEIPLPAGPLSYHGHFLNVDWFLQARADIPWAIDPKVERDILLVAGASPEPASSPPVDAELLRLRQQHNGLISWGLFLFSLPISATGCFLAYRAVVDGSVLTGIVLLVMGAAFVLVGLMMAFVGLRNRLAALRLGQVELDWPEGPLYPGDMVSLRLRLNAVEGLNAFKATLFCREAVVSGSGTNTTTHRHNIVSLPIELARTAESPTGLCVVEGGLALPQDAPPSFYAPDNELSWMVELHIDVARWPDWMRRLYLDVRPPRALAAIQAPAAERDEFAAVGRPEAFVEAGIDDTNAW